MHMQIRKNMKMQMQMRQRWRMRMTNAKDRLKLEVDEKEKVTDGTRHGSAEMTTVALEVRMTIRWRRRRTQRLTVKTEPTRKAKVLLTCR